MVVREGKRRRKLGRWRRKIWQSARLARATDRVLQVEGENINLRDR